MSCLSLGPRAGSYRPPTLGLFKSSKRIGLTICLTEMRFISSVVKNENEMLETVDGIECAMFIIGLDIGQSDDGEVGCPLNGRTDRKKSSLQVTCKLLDIN